MSALRRSSNPFPLSSFSLAGDRGRFVPGYSYSYLRELDNSAVTVEFIVSPATPCNPRASSTVHLKLATQRGRRDGGWPRFSSRSRWFVWPLSSRDPRSITLGVRGGINIMKTKDSGQPGGGGGGKIWRVPREAVRIRGTRRVGVINSHADPTISLSSSS